MAGKDKYGQVPPVPLFPGEVPWSPVMPARPRAVPLVLLNAQQKVEGHVRWALNNISLELRARPDAHGIGVSQWDTPTDWGNSTERIRLGLCRRWRARALGAEQHSSRAAARP